MSTAHPPRLSNRPTYTAAQLTQYFTHISLAPSLVLFAFHPSLTFPTLPLLASLQTHHLLTVPFENLSLHYSPTPLTPPSLEPADLFTKIVTRGHGGYCMESNAFFGTVLRSLGFTVVSVGGRVSDVAMGGRRGRSAGGEALEVGYGGW